MTALGKLSTHVLDTARGAPAAGMRIDVQQGTGPSAAPRKSVLTNRDGRTDAPLLEGSEMARGAWRLVFHVGEYFRAQRNPDAGRFLETVPVEFVIEDPEASLHVPLLVSPWSFTTYRGS